MFWISQQTNGRATYATLSNYPVFQQKKHRDREIFDFYLENGLIHLGIATTTEKVAHASGVTVAVEQGVVTGKIETEETIAIESLYKMIRHG